MHEMFIDKMFNDYQVKVIEELSRLIVSFMSQGKYAKADGVMQAANKIINLPNSISKEGDVKEKVLENLRKFQSSFIREAINRG